MLRERWCDVDCVGGVLGVGAVGVGGVVVGVGVAVRASEGIVVALVL